MDIQSMQQRDDMDPVLVMGLSRQERGPWT
jgi:hypothetical protein